MGRIVFAALFVTLCPGLAGATSYRLDISDLTGFQQSGVSGTAGNGIVFASPVYSFLPGDTVNFGTAIVSPDPPDGRAGPCPTNCFGIARFAAYFLTNGVGGIPPGSFELDGANFEFVDCSPSSSCQITYALLFTLGPMINGIQLGFQGSSLVIISTKSVTAGSVACDTAVVRDWSRACASACVVEERALRVMLGRPPRPLIGLLKAASSSTRRVKGDESDGLPCRSGSRLSDITLLRRQCLD
jgi:hypothetical protein